MAEPIVMRLTTPLHRTRVDIEANRDPNNRLCFEVAWDGVDPDVWHLRRYCWLADLQRAERNGLAFAWERYHAGVYRISQYRGRGESWLNYFAEAVHQYQEATHADAQHP